MARLPSLWQNILLFGALLLIVEAREAKHFHPKNMQPGVGAMPVAKRQDIPTGTCEPAKSNINETAIFLDACGLTQTDYQAICYQQLAASVNASARAKCSYYYTQYNDCLNRGSNNASSCNDTLAGYQNCANYTLQAYAICGYYYHLSPTISTCANILLQIHPRVLNSTSAPPPSAPTPAPEYAVPAPENTIPFKSQTPTPAYSDTAATGSNAPAAAITLQETTATANAVQNMSSVAPATDMHCSCPGKRRRSVLLG